MSTIEDNSATPLVRSSVQSWMESSIHGKNEKSRNMIIIHLSGKKSLIEHRSSNVSHPVENVACGQPSVSLKENKIQNSNFEYVPSKRQSEDPEEDDRKPAAKRK